ncbi:MAG: O-antigen ligase family protein [Planctomycetes bacterium]|nr:O-antigen ligase family protein [Planctomycetota bacterium]
MLWATLRGWNPLWRALGVFGVFSIPLCLFLSGTRTAMVVGVLSCAPILFRGSMLRSIGIWVLVGMLGIGAFMFGQSMLQGRSTRHISDRLTTLDLSGRASKWSYALESCLTSPVFGHGAGGAETLRQDSASGVIFHNAYLAIWYNTGIIGLVCVVSVLISQGLRAMYLMRRAPDPVARDVMRVAFGMLLALGAIGMVENSLSSPSDAVIAMFVMMVSLVERVRQMSEQGQAYAPTRPLLHADPYADSTQLGWSR